MSDASRCPDCSQSVSPTIKGHICGHLTTDRRRPCPGSFKPWQQVVVGDAHAAGSEPGHSIGTPRSPI